MLREQPHELVRESVGLKRSAIFLGYNGHVVIVPDA
jgi:hypothetical protein